MTQRQVKLLFRVVGGAVEPSGLENQHTVLIPYRPFESDTTRHVVMIFLLCAIPIILGCFLYIVYEKKRRYGIGLTLTGTVERMCLTFGRQGQQIVTIDGKNYNIWLPFKEFKLVEKGNVVTHQPFWNKTYGVRLLSTKIVAVQYKRKKNATSTQSDRSVLA